MNKFWLFALMLCFSMPVFAQENSAPVMDEEDLNFDIKEDAFGNILKPSISDDNIKVNTNQNLTQNLQANAEPNENVSEEQESQNENEGRTWISGATSGIKSLFTGNGKNSDATKDLLNQNKQFAKKERSNAAVFDIAGVMLKMSYQEAEKELTKRGYKKVTQKMEVPNFIRWRNEEKCRNHGVVGYERLESCIVKLAQKENYYYISNATFNKFDSKETIEIFLSSNFTSNKIYKITYTTEAAGVKGNSSKAIYLRNLKVYDFWKKINQKYGIPDDQQEAVWGMGENYPYLKASTGYLNLEDPLFKALDINRMAREDQKFIYTDNYTF